MHLDGAAEAGPLLLSSHSSSAGTSEMKLFGLGAHLHGQVRMLCLHE